MSLGKKHHLTATDAYELEGFIMDRFTKWLGSIRRTDEVPDAVKQTICDTLQNLPDAPERKIENRTWKHLAVAACVVILICGSVLAVNPSLAANLPILGTIFQKVEKGVIYSGEYKDAKKITQEKENHLSAQSQGIKLTASEVYCDGFSVYVTMKMQAEQMDFSKEGNGICVKAQYSFGKQMSKEDSDILMDGKCVDKHAFIGMMKFDKEDVIKKDGTLRIRILTVYLQDKEQSICGSWNFEIPYTVYKKGSREIAVNKKLNSHLAVKSVFVSLIRLLCLQRRAEACTARLHCLIRTARRFLLKKLVRKKVHGSRKFMQGEGV